MIVPESSCRNCLASLNDATGLDHRSPTPGSISVCWFCATVAIYADDLTLRRPNDEELEQLLRNRAVVAAILVVLEARAK